MQAGNYVKEQIMSSFVRLIATSPDLQTYSVQKLYTALKDDITQEGLILAGTWVIGEYGDSLLKGGQYEEEELVKEVKESDIVDLFATILGSGYSGQIVTQYIVTAAVKLSTRLTDAAQIEKLRRLLLTYETNLDVEIQQRAVEYSNLFGYDQVRRGVLEKMPPPEIREAQRVLGEATTKMKKTPTKHKKPSQITEQDMLLDLMGDSGESGAVATNGSQNNTDLLADILGGGTTSPQAQSTSPPPAQSNVANIMDLFNTTAPAAAAPSAASDLFSNGGMTSPPPQAAAVGPLPGQEAYNKHGLQISFQTRRDAQAVQVLARFRNASSGTAFKNVTLQAAVPKSQKLQLQAISEGDLGPGATASQQMRVVSVGGVSLFLSVV